MSNLKKKNMLNMILALLMFLILILASYFIYEIGIQNTNTEEKLYTLDVYSRSDGSLCLVREPDSACSIKTFSIEVENLEARVLQIDSNNLFILYDDNGLKIYDVKKKNKTEINLANVYKSYELHLNNSLDEIKGIIYTDNSSNKGYYSIKNQIKLYDLVYKNLNVKDENYLESSDDFNNYLLNANLEKIELTYLRKDENDCGVYYEVEGYNDKYFFIEHEGCMSDYINKIYNHNKQVIYDKIAHYHVSFLDGMLYLNDDNIIKKYDTSGNLLSTSKNLENVISVINQYAIITLNNELSIYNIDTKDIKKIINWSSNYAFDYYTSAYYSKEQLALMGENEKQEGLYVVIMYKEKDNNGYYGMEYSYNLETKEIVSYPITELEEGRAKPVLYLYPKEKTNIKVTFKYPSYLTTTYPKYNNGFQVTAYPNGDLYDEDNKYYYALYWDEIRYHEVNFTEGFYVEEKEAMHFLEEKLSLIGLNERERNECIMYYLPILEKNKQSIVYFELTDERNKHNPIIIEPKPDSMLRVSLHIKKVNQKVNIKEQQLKTFQRTGFSVIEWGGMIY